MCSLCFTLAGSTPGLEGGLMMRMASSATPTFAGVQALCKPCHSAQSLLIQSQTPTRTPLSFASSSSHKTNAAVLDA